MMDDISRIYNKPIIGIYRFGNTAVMQFSEPTFEPLLIRSKGEDQTFMMSNIHLILYNNKDLFRKENFKTVHIYHYNVGPHDASGNMYPDQYSLYSIECVTFINILIPQLINIGCNNEIIFHFDTSNKEIADRMMAAYKHWQNTYKTLYNGPKLKYEISYQNIFANGDGYYYNFMVGDYKSPDIYVKAEDGDEKYAYCETINDVKYRLVQEGVYE